VSENLRHNGDRPISGLPECVRVGRRMIRQGRPVAGCPPRRPSVHAMRSLHFTRRRVGRSSREAPQMRSQPFVEATGLSHTWKRRIQMACDGGGTRAAQPQRDRDQEKEQVMKASRWRSTAAPINPTWNFTAGRLPTHPYFARNPADKGCKGPPSFTGRATTCRMTKALPGPGQGRRVVKDERSLSAMSIGTNAANVPARHRYLPSPARHRA